MPKEQETGFPRPGERRRPRGECAQAILAALDRIERKLEAMADELKTLQDREASTEAKVDALIAIANTENAKIADLAAQLAALAGQTGGIAPADVQAVADKLQAVNDRIDAATAALTPPST